MKVLFFFLLSFQGSLAGVFFFYFLFQGSLAGWNTCTTRGINWSVLIRVHGGPGTESIYEKIERGSNPEPVQNQFFSFKTKLRLGSIYGTGPGGE